MNLRREIALPVCRLPGVMTVLRAKGETTEPRAVVIGGATVSETVLTRQVAGR